MRTTRGLSSRDDSDSDIDESGARQIYIQIDGRTFTVDVRTTIVFRG